ncbi:MAG: hypothetical protein KAT70_00450 [Thermoplasmata archaeon]|nr:hypothetical protein [Thermoplasmata archaeon]
MNVYLPSLEKVEEWKQLAKKERMSLSKFVIEHVEDNILQNEVGYESKVALVNKSQKLREENEQFRDRVAMLETVVKRLDDELKSYRRMPFADGRGGPKDFDDRLMSLFKEHREIAYEELHGLFGIDPRDTEAVKAIEVEMDGMVRHGLVKETRRGWRWKT